MSEERNKILLAETEAAIEEATIRLLSLRHRAAVLRVVLGEPGASEAATAIRAEFGAALDARHRRAA